MIGGRRVRGLTMGEAIPQQFVPSLIEQWRAGRFPVERLVTTFDLKDADAAVAAMRRHEVIKPILTHDSGDTQRGRH